MREPRAYLTTVAQRLLIDHYRRLSLEQAWLETLAHVGSLGYAEIAQRLAVSERGIKRYMVQAFKRCILLIL